MDEMGWIPNREYMLSDSGQTGQSYLTRSGLQRLLAAAAMRSCPFQCIVIDDTSRLGRSTTDVLTIAEKFNYYGIRLYFVAQRLDSENLDTFQQMLHMYANIDQMFIKKLAHGVHRGMEGRIIAGMSVGGPCCFGYRSEEIPDPTRRSVPGRPSSLGFKITIYEPEAEVVRYIFAWACEGLSLREIAKRCNSGELLRPKQGPNLPWTGARIHRILRNERYIGNFTWNRTKAVRNPDTHERESQLRPESEWQRHYCFPDLRIISDEVWNRVQANRSANTKLGDVKLGGLGKREAYKEYLLSAF